MGGMLGVIVVCACGIFIVVYFVNGGSLWFLFVVVV